MGRPTVHATEDFIDAAARLFAGGGVRALTMSAVAREVGAPSGSIYHRYPNRPALVAAMWIRTAQSFEEGYLAELGDPPTPEGAVRAAVWMVEWSRAHLSAAIVLQAGVETFEPAEWSDAARAEWKSVNDDRRRRTGDVVRALVQRTGRPADQITFAMLDLPLAALRRHLVAGKRPPKHVANLVGDLTGLILTTPGSE